MGMVPRSERAIDRSARTWCHQRPPDEEKPWNRRVATHAARSRRWPPSASPWSRSSAWPDPSLAVVPADYSNVVVGLQPFMTGLDGPVLVTNAGDGSRRLFVVEQRGVIKVWRSGHALSTFLDMRSKVESSSEQGLLALAFHPDYEHNRKFYVLFTEKGTGDVIVAEYKASTVDRNKASSSSFRRLLRIGHRDNTNHNGGMLAFGKKNGYLYISVGDGGGGGDTPNNAQNLGSRLGKLLRIDVNGTQTGLAYRIPSNNPWAKSKTAKREIWSYGLRNPWRFSFDRLTGDTWIGDVGQGAWEEVDKAAIGGSGGRAANYGWHIMEGNACYQPSSGCPMTGLQLPVAVYDHGAGCAIIGGYVYRGPETRPPGRLPVLGCLLGDDLVDRRARARRPRARRSWPTPGSGSRRSARVRAGRCT